MTVRYTAIDSMEEAALRDVDRNAERWRDKIEVRLDNRQVFFLFFGSAIVACMLFVLGVLVGKRIESRGQAASPELQDPLAMLDRAQAPTAGMAVAPAPQLTFPNTLIAPTSAKPAKATKLATIAPPAPKPAVVIAPPKPLAVVAPPKPLAVVAPPKPIAPVPALAPKAAPPKPLAMAATKPVAVVVESKPEPKAEAKADHDQKKGKFTLHLSTFASAEEANAFAQRYPGAFVVAGDVPGRGMAFRVRYGNFPSYKDATSAKDAFEKQHNTIALIAAR
jgi:cell division septation protein DedD